MKSETQIAQENIEIFKNPFPNGIEGNPWTTKIREGVKRDVKESMETHKQTLQRFLEFLEELDKATHDYVDEIEQEELDNKITDLKQAIKLYEENKI